MRPLLLVLLCLTFLAGPSAAQEGARGQALRAMLDLMPAALFQGGEALVWFGDAEAAAGLSLDAADEDGMLAPLRALPAARFGEALFAPPEAWRARVGIDPGDIAQSLHLDAPPLQATLLRLADAERAAALQAALLAQGYEPRGAGSQAPLWRGEDDAVNLFERAPEDIFRGPLGRSARVQVEGALVRHATNWPLFDALADATAPRAARHAPVAALLDALDAAEAGEGRLVQALILTETAGLAAGDPLRPAARSLLGGGPLLLADLSTGRREVAVLAFMAPLSDMAGDMAGAGAVAGRIARAWDERAIPQAGQTLAALTGSPARVAAWLSKSGPVIVLVVETATAERFGLPENPGFQRLVDALMRRDLVFLEE